MTDTSTPDAFLTLTPDVRAVVSRELTQLGSTVGEMLNQVRKAESPEKEFLQNLLGVAEFHFSDVAKALGLASESGQIVKWRSQALREANQRVYELETQIGQGVGPVQLKAGIKHLTQRLEKWWRQSGFGHTQSVNFSEHSCEVVFSCSLFGNFRLVDSDTPISDKERRLAWHTRLRNDGFVLSVSESFRDADLIDCDQSRTALVALIKRGLPTARIWSYESRATHNLDDAQMRLVSVTIQIRDYDEIANLPVVEEPGD